MKVLLYGPLAFLITAWHASQTDLLILSLFAEIDPAALPNARVWTTFMKVHLPLTSHD